ncbi:phage tail protein, partial [Enterococcus faecalis]
YPAISRFSDYFENGYQIKAKPNDLEEYHIFEIKQTFKDTFTNSIVIYAQSRTYKLGNRQVRLVTVDNRNGAEAMKLIEQNMDEPCDIKLYSDINTASSTTFEARNVLNCIAGEQGSLLQYWGGEIKREPFKLSLLRRRGRDNVGTVRYGKDLKGLTIKFDWQSIVTKVLPFAELQSGADGTSQRIYGNAVKSEYISKYPDVYAQYIQFTEDQGVKDLASLNKVASKYFTTLYPGSDKPKVSIELEIEKLTDSEEAKEFAKMRNYNLFDTFTVYHKLYDIDIQTKVTGIVYDALAEKTIKITAGDIQVAFYKQQSQDFQEAIKTLTKKEYMSDFVDYITDLINGVEGGSIRQYPKNRPNTHYYLDTESTDTAKDVIAINHKGIGFSRTG